MEAVEPNWQGLIVALAAWLAGCVGFFFLAGNLPVKAAPKAVQTGIGPGLVWLNLAVFTVLAGLTGWYAVHELRWTSIVVGGGFVFLFAPFIVQDLPGRLKDTQAGLMVLLVLGGAAICLVKAAG